jgi:hypothetical protein
MGKPVGNNVVNYAPVFVTHRGIQCLMISQLFNVIRYYLLQAGKRVLTFNFESAHMRDIE